MSLTATANSQDATQYTVAGGSTIKIYSPSLQINWNPLTNSFAAIFNTAAFLNLGAAGVVPLSSPSQVGALPSVSASPLLTTLYVATANTVFDPVTGADLHGVSVAGIMTLIEAGFTVEYNKAYSVRQTQIQVNTIAAQVRNAVNGATPDGTKAAFTYSANGTTVTFVGAPTVGNANTTIVSYGWLLGDPAGAASSVLESPTYTYANTGTYTVNFVVTDSANQASVTSQQVVVA